MGRLKWGGGSGGGGGLVNSLESMPRKGLIVRCVLQGIMFSRRRVGFGRVSFMISGWRWNAGSLIAKRGCG
jgi:hypothetical protein